MGANVKKIGQKGKYSVYKINGKEYRLQDFNEVKTIEQAYLIGYLLGDGAFSKRSKKKKEKMSVSSINEDTIRFFKEEFCPDSTYRDIIPVNKTRDIYTDKKSYILPFSSVFSDIFAKYGLMNLKGERKLIVFEDDKIMRAYLLGFLDADGCITYSFREKEDGTHRVAGCVGFSHPSYYVMEELQSWMKRRLNIYGGINEKTGEDCRAIRVGSHNSVAEFIKYLYEYPLTFANKEKREKAMELLFELGKPKLKVQGVKIDTLKSGAIRYCPFIKIGRNITYLEREDTYDKAVENRIISEALNFEVMAQLSNYNPTTNTIQLTYLSHDDNKTTHIEVDLEGNILKFEKEDK